MKRIHGFWIPLAALGCYAVFRFLGPLLGDPLHPLSLWDILISAFFGSWALYVGFTGSGTRRYLVTLRVMGFVLFLTIVLTVVPLGLSAILAWLQAATLVVATMSLSFEATRDPRWRLLIALVALALALLAFFGVIGVYAVVVAIVLVPALAVLYWLAEIAGRHADEDAQRMREGKPPKWAAFYDPKNPYGPFRKK